MPVQLNARSNSPATEAALARTADAMEALVAAYALMAHADGEAAVAERRRMFALLREMPAMSVFSHEEIADRVAEHEANFRFDPEVAQQMARERIAVVAEDARTVRQVVSVARHLIGADGIAHPAEYRALRDIRLLLGDEETARPPRRPAVAQTGLAR